MAEKCKECGCECAQCMQQNDQHHGEMQLHVEIENLRQRLLERDNHIVTMETHFLSEADKFPNGELASIKEEILIWQEKYSRLHDAHKRVQKVNQNLEDKLLRIVDKCETEKGAFTKDIATLSHRLADANYTIHRLTQDNEKYRNDVNLAIQLLQCKPSNFVGQKYDSLPSEVQAKVRTYVAQKRRSSDVSPPDVKSITVPISTFPPTAMVYNVTKPTTTDKHSDDDSDDSKPPVDIVSAAIMAKVLEDRERERIFAKHCDTCTCHKSILLVDAETQTTSTYEPCNECMSKCSHVADARTDSLKHTDASQNEKQNFLVHTVFQKINENTLNSTKVQHYSNGKCTKHTNCQFGCAREKVIVRNGRSLEASKEDNRVASNMKSSLSKKSSIRRNDAAVQMAPQCRTESANKQSVLQNVTETSINKVSTDKAKQTRANKRPDSQADIKSNSNCWNKFERKASSYNNTTCENSQRYPTVKEQSPIDIINDRLWKNEWAKLNSDTYARDNKNKRCTDGDIDIDVINDRAWRNDRTVPEARHPTQLTLIEVKNIDNVNDNDRHLDVATSPSYSSDSIVISTSDPSSSSSDVVHSIPGAQTVHNSSNVKSSSQTKITGPRNCLVRVTPGSKNILLDNVGHYKTVLYTSGGNKPNTALVHVKKGSRSGSERSTSASSDDNSPVLLHDNNQLQRVAEWVQSSVRMDKSEQNDCKIQKPNENASSKRQSASLMFVSETKSKSNPVDAENVHEMSVRDVEEFSGKNARGDLNTLSPSSDVESLTQDKEKDLITFDTPVAEGNHLHNTNKISTELDYEVKITKEMEETYLKLAASLDPVALSLTRSDDIDMTIEKYRRDHKKPHVQKSQDRAGSTT